ncbi:MAG: Clp protease N-terminal domain-containing protein [Fimbriimonas sp.]
MWQRFTERSRKVVFYAQEEAQKLGDGYVSTEHLLLGLLREGESTAGQALDRLGVDREQLRLDLCRQLELKETGTILDMTLTPRAKRVIDLAYDEARNLNDNFIGTEHLLLGLIREEDGLAGRILLKFGVHLKQARSVVEDLHEEAGIPRTTPAAPARSFPASEALHIRQQLFPYDRLALMLMSEEGAALKLLREMDLPINVLRSQIEQALLIRPSPEQVKNPDSLDAVLLRAVEVAKGVPLNSAHLFVAIAEDESTFLNLLLKDGGVEVEGLREQL